MLHEFLTLHRTELIRRCLVKVAARARPENSFDQYYGIPPFLDQVIRTLQLELSDHPSDSEKVSGSAGGVPMFSEMDGVAKQHGREMLKGGFSVDQVVHDYGDLCQAITDLAFEKERRIEVSEFRILNRCLDNAIADSVLEYDYQGHMALHERFDSLAHEVGNLMHTATLALSAIKTGLVPLQGATGGILDRCLEGVTNLVASAISEAHGRGEIPSVFERISVADLVREIQASTALESNARNCVLNVSPVDPGLAVDADRSLLSAALTNLLLNAFKFTRPQTEISLSAYASGDRVRIDVGDHCGGLPQGFAETMGTPYMQADTDRSGLGLGLFISRRNIVTNKGLLTVRDVPGVGCVFTIDLPRREFASPPAADGA